MLESGQIVETRDAKWLNMYYGQWANGSQPAETDIISEDDYGDYFNDDSITYFYNAKDYFTEPNGSNSEDGSNTEASPYNLENDDT